MNVKELVSNQLAAIAPVVKNRVIALLVEQEQEKRVNAVVKVIALLDEARKAKNKLKPDVVSYDSDFKVASETFSKARMEELRKNGETLSRLESALDDAFSDTPNFDKVFKVLEKTPEKE